jgi:hypothetical protein
MQSSTPGVEGLLQVARSEKFPECLDHRLRRRGVNEFMQIHNDFFEMGERFALLFMGRIS